MRSVAIADPDRLQAPFKVRNAPRTPVLRGRIVVQRRCRLQIWAHARNDFLCAIRPTPSKDGSRTVPQMTHANSTLILPKGPFAIFNADQV
jgi:hypothetical protein